jgi:DNA-binding LacI/PurR family transcriptional regulator
MTESVASSQASRRATIRDVAARAAVSLSTASRVLGRNNITVRPATRERIFQAARALDYHPNAAARQLKLVRADAIGMLLPDFTNPVYASIVRGAVRRASDLGYVMLTAEIENEDAGVPAYRRLVHERRIDGLIVATALQADGVAAELVEANVPHVFANRRVRGAGRSVTVDDEGGAALAARRLIDAGHRRVAVVAGPTKVDTARRRRAGFQAACREAGIATPVIASGSFDPRGGYAAMMRLLTARPRPTGVFVSQLFAAVGAVAAVHEMGLSVPDDISLIAFDDAEIAAFMTPPLTTIRMPMPEMGAAAVELLHLLLEGGTIGDVVVKSPAVLVERHSVGPPHRR